MTADADKEKNVVPKNTHCLVCNSRVGVSTRNSCEIFHKYMLTTTERPLAYTISAVLGEEISEETVHSNVICKKCFKLFDEVDEIEARLIEVRTEILDNYQKTLIVRAEEKNNIPGMSDECKLPLSSEDGNVVKEKLFGRGRKKTTPKKIKGLHSTNSEEDNDQKENTLCEEELSGHETDMDGQCVLGEEMGEEPPNELHVKIKIEPGIAPIERHGHGHGRRRKQKLLMEEDNFPENVVAREGLDFSCLLCAESEKVVGDMKIISIHLKAVHNIRVYICDICGDDFRQRSKLSHHLDEHVAAEDGDFQCEVCNRIFSNLRLFRVHKRMHYPQAKLWTCDTCGKRYSSRNLLEEHINTHTGARPYICEICHKDFASKYTFKAHVKTHEVRPRPFCCNDCGKTFLSQQNLIQHERTHTGLRNYVCEQCGKAFGSARNLEVHSVVHSGYKPYICRTCGKAFARKAEIRDHERIHTGEKPYQCEFCGATFSQRSNLQSHKRATHYQDKRYKCENCGKGFKRRRLLDYHVKAAHTGERPYKCLTCDATFVYPEHFKKHRRIHTGEKPYQCEVCGKAFNSRDNRNAHRFVHSDKKPYECLVCGVGFMRKPLLYNHMQTQGHLNDTIVVNQPRLTSDEDLLAEATELAEGTEVEMTIVNESGHHDQETKLYITELKEHVIIQHDGEERTVVVGPGGEEEDDDGHMVHEAVEHLIIDGQVHFADASEIANLHGDIGSVTEITTTPSGFSPHHETRHTLMVPATPNIISPDVDVSAYEEQIESSGSITTLTSSQTVPADNGQVHLVHIRIPQSEHDDGNRNWFHVMENQ